jgi:hypothetical protein
VVNAAQAAFFIAAEEKRRAAVRAVFAEQTNFSFAIAKRDQIFAEQTDADRRAVGFKDLA